MVVVYVPELLELDPPKWELSKVTEFFLLASVSYDRYIAICRPLYYTTARTRNFTPVILGLQLGLCGSAAIDHLFCDVLPLLLLSCSDTGFLELTAFILALGTLLVTLVLVAVSYTAIARTILRLSSTQQKRKDFSTCSSYTVVVSIIYGSCIFMYMKPSAKDRVDMTKGVAVLYTTVVTMLNPFIYTLRNQQVKAGHQRPGAQVEFSTKGCDPGRNPESAMRNQTSVTEFIFLGLTDNPDRKNVIFLFLLLKISFTSVTIPELLVGISTGDRTISYNAFVIQFFFVIFLGETEIFLLAAMSYNRYVAICQPLHYLTIMSRRQLHIHAHQPSPEESLDFNKRVPVPNISVAPMLNPFIYTLRNQQVKQAIRDVAKRAIFFKKK
ncbi:olfactory receptor 6C65-like [Tachyglossus aculeatus]|uniref:olfactory receptor 6C65-like n=1 Tax=Tachyglossus aculeatus TaxID=9261 RepID=UPI0018F48240|nr:olfactory receptor 6C65-like [Tachyglossus aculeatus]